MKIKRVNIHDDFSADAGDQSADDGPLGEGQEAEESGIDSS